MDCYYSYEALTRSWLSHLIYRGCPKPFANSFLKQEWLIKGSPNAPQGSEWAGPHQFYKCTLASSGATGVYFHSSSANSLRAIVVAAYPELDPNGLYVASGKRVEPSAFSTIEPVKFTSTEALQATRSGLRLTHNADLYQQNKKVYDDFTRTGHGAVVSVDVESYEHEHSVILEIGWAIIEWHGELDGIMQTSVECQHAIISDALGYRNGTYTPDNRNHFIFGKSMTISEADTVNMFAQKVNHLSKRVPVLLVTHSASSEISYFKTLGMDTSNWQMDLPKIDADRPVGEANDIVLQAGTVYIQDTQKLFAASGIPGSISQIGLSKALQLLQIPARRLHNAGNDAYFTLAVYEALVGEGVLRADLQAKEAPRVAAEKAKKKAEEANGGWGTGW